jgi:hypothetical protein
MKINCGGTNAGLTKTTIPPLRRSGFCLFDEKPLDFGVFARVFVLPSPCTKPAAGAKFGALFKVFRQL